MSVELVSQKVNDVEQLFLWIRTSDINMKLDISHGDLLGLEYSIMNYQNGKATSSVKG